MCLGGRGAEGRAQLDQLRKYDSLHSFNSDYLLYYSILEVGLSEVQNQYLDECTGCHRSPRVKNFIIFSMYDIHFFFFKTVLFYKFNY